MNNAFREITKQKPKFEEQDPKQCAAHDCPCRASVNAGGGWTCSAHAYVPADRWPSVTRGLRDNSWLSEFIDEMRKMDYLHQDWRGFAMQFWENSDKSCQPDPREGAMPYQNRMRGELIFRAGGMSKRPQVRLPKPSAPARGYFAERAGA